ncbi:MAG: prepilin peptidase [Lachnospiraceae bacterium]|nr:prepilin peptidase [Lachnospiraceae bacterium]
MEFFQKGCWLVFFVMLVWVAWVDIKSRRISNEVLIFLFLNRTFVLIMGCLKEDGIVMEAVLGFLIGGGVFFLVYWRTKGGVGGGDVKLLAVVGYYVGRERVWNVMFWAALLAVLGGIQGIGTEKRVAFGPYVLAGTVLAMGMGGLG